MAAGASRHLPKPPCIAVAASGGLDSTALLHCLSVQCAGTGIKVHALHVHHGLQPAADDWAAQVARQCRDWSRRHAQVVFHLHRIASGPPRGASVEAWARGERYAALAAMARAAGCGVVLLAHHRRDQAETVLLQALRGAGPSGLAAMPRAIERDGILWLRPWLQQPREAIAAYAHRHRLAFVEDPSNREPRYARSRLRLGLWRELQARFGDAEVALARVAARAQEARALLEEIAGADAAHAIEGTALLVGRWQALSASRRANLLRFWAASRLGRGVPDSLVARLLAELPGSTDGLWPAGDVTLALHAGRLDVLPQAASGAGVERAIDLSRPGLHDAAPWPGHLVVESAAAGGVPSRLLLEAVLRPRGGGERFQLRSGSTARSLKKQFQALQVPRWQRDGPLVHAGGLLVFVPGLGLDARAAALPGEPRVTLSWRPGAATAAG